MASATYRAWPAVMAALAGLACGSASAQTLSWNNAGGGSAASAGNWNPAQVPVAANDLLFNLNNTYSVTWSSGVASSHAQIIRRGTLTYSLSAAHTASAGITVGDTNALTGSLTLTTGTLNSGGPITVGSAVGSGGTLIVNDDDADLIMTGATSDMIIGSNGPGTLSVTGGGLVQVADQFIAGNNAAGTSTVTVSGATSSFPLVRSTLSVLGTGVSSKLGQGGDATVNISNGALASFGGDVVVSNGSASTSTVTVAGIGGLVPQQATLQVDGDVLLGANTTAGSAGGAATLNVNADGQVLIGGALRLGGDPDGGTAMLHTATGGLLSLHSLAIGQGFALDMDGGEVDISGGTLEWTATSSSPRFNGGAEVPAITMQGGATALLNATAGGPALVVGGGAGANSCEFDVRSGSDLSVSGSATLGEGADDFGGMVISGAGTTLSFPSFTTLTVGSAGQGSLEAEIGAAVSGFRLSMAASAGSVGDVRLETAGTSASFREVYVGGTQGGAGGHGHLDVRGTATLTVGDPGSVIVYAGSVVDLVNGGLLNAVGVNPLVFGDLNIDNGGRMNAQLTQIMNGGTLRGGGGFVGSGRLDSATRILSGGTLELNLGDLEVGNETANGFDAQDGSLVSVGSHTLTIHDSDRARVDVVTMNGGHIIAPHGLEIVTPGTNGTLDGTGTITAGELFFASGASVITSTGAGGITINGKLRNNSGGIDGTKYTFNSNPDITDSGWTGAGTIDARVVFNSGTKVNALANMTMGLNVTDGVTFNAGSELHADTRTVTLIDSNGIGLPSVTDLSGGHVVCGQPLTVNAGRRLSGRGGSVDSPLVTVFGRLSPGELAGAPAGETGELTINGSLTLGASAITDIELGGLLAPVTYDRVVVNGNCALNGVLNVSEVDGFHLGSGQSLVVMTADSFTGSFSAINAPANCRVFVTPTIVVVGNCPADFNQDGFVDFFDYDAWIECFETFNEGVCINGGNPDFNFDGFVDFFDVDEFTQAFEAGC